jgi:hypothetical protein
MAALKAEEAQRTAALKADHAKTPGTTGLLAKLTGHEDPVKKAEKQQLAAEIARAEEATKAEHSFENADLKARKAKEHATVGAADSLMGSGSSGYGDHSGLKRSGAGLHDEHGRDNKLYNHATGAKGAAALQDDGLGDHHHGARSATGHHNHGHDGSQNAGGFGGGPQSGLGHSIMGSGPDNGLGDHHHGHHDHAGRTDTGHHNNDHHGHDGSQNAGGFGGGSQTGFGGQNMGGTPQIFTQVVGQAPVMAQMPVAAVPIAASSMPASSCSGGIAPMTVIAPGQGGRY